MKELTKKEKEILTLAEEGGDDSDLLLKSINKVGELEDRLESLEKKVDQDPPEDVKIEKVAMRLATKLAQVKDGEDGHTPTDEELIALIKPLIPDVQDGKTPTKDELLELIKPLIPLTKHGEMPSDEHILTLIGSMMPVITPVDEGAIEKRIEANLESKLPQFGAAFRDGLELLNGEDRLDKVAVKGISEIESRIDDVRRMAAANAVPVTTNFFNGYRAKNLNIIGGSATQSGDTVNVTVAAGVTVAEIDGSPSVANVSTIKFTNGSVTDNGDGTVNVATGAGGGGDVSKVGTPVNNQMAVWTGDGTLEGTSDITYDGANLNLVTGKSLQVAGATILADTAGTTTLSNIDALDATTESTIETAIDTLANLTSIQGRTVTLADAGANAIFGWDDVAGAYENLTAAEATATLNNMVGDAGAGGTKGLAPAPAAGDAAAGKFLKADGTWTAPAGGGNVSKVGTPVDNQVGVWTGDGTIEGDAALTFDTATDVLSVGGTVELGHASDTTLSRASAGQLAVEGVNVLMNGGALGTPSSGTLTNCTGLPLAGVTDSTSEALGVGSLELGHATDTTITRVSAGVAAIEGVNILTTAGGTLTGNLTFGENTSLDLDPAGSADGKYTGIAVTGTAGEALAFGDVIVLDVTAGKWFKGSVSAAAGADGDLRGGTGMCVLAAAGDASATKILLMGTCRADANFPALTVGSVVYATTAGDITVTRPSTTDHVIKVLGYALTADEIYFNPSMDYMTQV